MKKSTFAIIVALVVALCVPAVAFAALIPSPAVKPAASAETARPAVQPKADPTPAPEVPAVPSEDTPEPEAPAVPDGRDASRAYGYCQPGACGTYADADGDGLCDTCAGSGANCPGYVDADDNGVCDNYESGAGRHGHHGAGNGRGHGCMR